MTIWVIYWLKYINLGMTMDDEGLKICVGMGNFVLLLS